MHLFCIHSFIHYLLTLLLFFATNELLAQTNSIQYISGEITLQTENIIPEDIVRFTLTPVGEAYYWNTDECNYVIETMQPAIHEIQGNDIGSGYFYTILHKNNLPSNFEFLLGKLEIKVEVIGEPEETLYFYWDVADCQYYSPSNCGFGGAGGDIVLRYNGGYSTLYFYWGTNPSNINPPNGNWEVVNGVSKRWIDYAKLKIPAITDECPLTPSTPAGFSLSGYVGENPVLSWNENSERMLAGYNLYRALGNSSYSHLTTFGGQTTSYTDNGVIIGDKRFDPLACYRLTAFGLANNESEMTFARCRKAGGVNKSSSYYQSNDEKHINRLIGAYPNPFNPTTTIRYELENDSFVNIRIYDILGHEIKAILSKEQKLGIHNVLFDGNKLPSGNYIYKIEVGNYTDSKTFQLVK